VTFVTSESISTLAVDLLSAELSLTQTVSQVPSGDVAPPTGGETTLRVPVPREAKIQPRGANLDYTEIDEVPVDFSIDHIYDGARVTEHQRSLDIVDFGRQVTRNQVRAVVAGAERQLASVMNALPIDEEVTPDGSDFDNVIADANALLDEAENPMENRWLAVSPGSRPGSPRRMVSPSPTFRVRSPRRRCGRASSASTAGSSWSKARG
jgi:P22 coat protein - gene protein 5.